MTIARQTTDSERYARCIAASRRVHWDIERDVIRGRSFDHADAFLPDGLSQVDRLDFLGEAERRFLGQIQGRTYANMFGLVERFINAKVLELSREHWLGDQTALEALVGFSAEEIKHQALFRRIETLAAAGMPAGYRFAPTPDGVAEAVLSKGSWAVLALTLHIELFTQAHYRESIAHTEGLSPLFKDVFLYHWREESQHAILDEIELRRHHAGLGPAARDRGIDEFIELVGAVDGILQLQAEEDARYFAATCHRVLKLTEREKVRAAVLEAYRWQYIVSGAQHPHFVKVLQELATPAQLERIEVALAPLL